MFGPTAPQIREPDLRFPLTPGIPRTCASCRRPLGQRWWTRSQTSKSGMTVTSAHHYACPPVAIPLTPLLVLVFVVAFIASLLTLALSALPSSQSVPGGSVPADPAALRVAGGSAVLTSSAASSGTGEAHLSGRIRVTAGSPGLDGAAVRASGALRLGAMARGESIEARASTSMRQTAGDGDRLTSGPSGTSAGGSQLESHARATDTDGGTGETAAAATPIPAVIIRSAAAEFGVGPDVLLRRAYCESRFDKDAVGRAQEVNVFQFLPSTWVIYAPKVGYSLREIGHVEAQARVAAYMESIGEGGQWSCR